ncbi:MAG TPA: hypothetical protein VF043_04630, partial [Ktedonobacteraceae bacterium]
ENATLPITLPSRQGYRSLLALHLYGSAISIRVSRTGVLDKALPFPAELFQNGMPRMESLGGSDSPWPCQ